MIGSRSFLKVMVSHIQIIVRKKNITFHELKTVDTIGNCQRLAFTVGVSQHMHKTTNLWKFEVDRSSNLRDNNERKNTLVTRSFVRLDGWFRDLKFWTWGLEIIIVEKYFFLENYGTSEGAVSHNVLYHQPIPITRHQERFMPIILSNYQ